MPVENDLTYRLMLKPTGGFWLLFSDRTLIDIDMTPAEQRDLARLMIEHASLVEKIQLGAVHASSAPQVQQCQ